MGNVYIYIIRHGETRSNVEGLLQGWTNDPLNENGIELAKVTGMGMKDIKFDLAISSPLTRALQTAKIVLEHSGNKDIEIVLDDRIKEINMGDWEQKKFRPGECEIPVKECKAFFSNAFYFSGCPNGENIEQVCQRTQVFLKELASREDLKDRNVLVATHGFALRGMLNFLYEDPSDYWHGHVPYNCAVNIIKVTNGKMELIADDKVYYDLNKCVDRYANY